MSEMEEFALRLKKWGAEGCFPELSAYADALATQVEAFDIDRLPKTLQGFPAVCRSAEQRQNHTP